MKEDLYCLFGLAIKATSAVFTFYLLSILFGKPF